MIARKLPAKAKIIKARKCKAPGCDHDFMPQRPLQVACSPGCALSMVAHANAKKAQTAAKVDRKETKAKLEKLKTRSEHAKDTEKAVNRYVVVRDKDEPCISCGEHYNGVYHAGHYRSVGSNPELRYEPLNIWKQCPACNLHKHGNLIEYRKSLLVKIGAQKLDWLEGPHPMTNYGIAELNEIKKHYSELARRLQRGV